MQGKTVAIVGGAPSAAANPPGRIDSHDVVVRVNNYRMAAGTGKRCDVFYSYFGGAIKKTVNDLIADGVRLCWCKCPDAKPIESDWHERNGKQNGIDFRYIYKARENWWFCDTFIPSVERFLAPYEMLGRHIPTTGFAALIDVLSCNPGKVYLTGFDFFKSGKHNLTDAWHAGKNTDDPIRHRPDLECQWLAQNLPYMPHVDVDLTLAGTLEEGAIA